MPYRYDTSDDYDYRGYSHNPRVAGAREEAESQRVMAIVQYVEDLLFDNKDLTDTMVKAAKQSKKLKDLVDATVGALAHFGLSKRQAEVVQTALKYTDTFDAFSQDQVYYTDEGDSGGQDPGIVVTVEDTFSKPSEQRLRGESRPYRKQEGRLVIVSLSYSGYKRQKGRTRFRPFKDTFLQRVWPYVTDEDVRNAVRILKQQGVSFLRIKRLPTAEYEALPEEEKETGDRYSYYPAAVRTREEFLTARAAKTLGTTVLRVNLREVVNALAKIDFGPDDVVYRYAGTNDTIAGASGQGFYVAQLRPGQLTLEGLSPPVGLGICVGGTLYRDSVTAGTMKVYSIRAPSGKPKFTLSVIGRSVNQVKGAANRLPGFEKGSPAFKGQSGVDEVRLLVDFLKKYVRLPETTIYSINDLRAGLRAMENVGVDPFSPPAESKTWAQATAPLMAMREEYVDALRAYRRLQNDPNTDIETLDEALERIENLGDTLDAKGLLPYEEAREIQRKIDQEMPEVERPERRRRRGDPGALENPDSLYIDPEVAALAEAAYAQPMGGRWTYEDNVDEGDEP